MRDSKRSFWARWKWAIIALVILLVVYLFSEHKAHIMSWLSFFEIILILVLLICPLMHLFMHHGHKHKNNNKHPHDDFNGEK